MQKYGGSEHASGLAGSSSSGVDMASISSCSRRAAREASMRSSHPTLSVLLARAAATPRWNAIAQARSPMECDSNSVSARHPDGSAILSAHDIQMAELDASWRAALAHVCFTAKGRGPKVGAARGAEFKGIPRCGFGPSFATCPGCSCANPHNRRRTLSRTCPQHQYSPKDTESYMY